MSVRLYLIFCNHCAYKQITDGSDLDNLVEVKTCAHCSGARQFKCPKCGYLLKVGKAQTTTVSDGQQEIKKIREAEITRKEQIKKEMKRLLKEKQRDDKEDT